MLPTKSYQPEKTCTILKRGKHPQTSSDLNENHIIRFYILKNANVEVSNSYIKNVEFLLGVIVLSQ